MKVLYAKSFMKDIDALGSNADIRKRLLEAIQRLKHIETLNEIHGIKKIEGYSDYYRLRIGDYRLGIKLTGGGLELIRFLHRKDIYRRFP